MDLQVDQGQFLPLVRQYADFLRNPDRQSQKREAVLDLLESGRKRLIVSLDDIRQTEEALARSLVDRPLEHMMALNQALRELIKEERPELKDDESALRRFHIGIQGSLGEHRVTPRGLVSKLIGTMVEIEGIVTRVSLVRPKLVKSVHYNKTTNKLVMREYREGISGLGMEGVFGAPSAYLTKDEEGNILETEYGKCEYLDNQRVVVQEMPEKSPPGQLPRSIDVIVEDDLVENCKPGDRIRVVGIFRALGGVTTAQGSGVFKTAVVANSMRQLREDSTGYVRITEGDTKNIRSVSKRNDLYKLLFGSVAPSICGHEHIKKAILLMMLGGNEKNIGDGTHLRGDINLLMIGDPSTAKSQLLRFVMHLAPLSVSTTGRGSTGVGLTAAVTSDPDTGDRHLEAGAMVLADRGVVCIDEFDKMSDEDRVAIHEVMEQQTVTIAKAGIHASLNARCSVIAAANPIYGSYDTRKTTYENSALPDSLLSRFDLIFTVLDMMDEEIDIKIATHVLRVHQYRRPGHDAEHMISLDGRSDDEDDSSTKQQEDGTSIVFDRNAKKVYGAKGRRAKNTLSVDFLRKYLFFAKTKFKPVLTSEAAEYIAQKYRDLRATFLNSTLKTLPITARCLETMIRLSTAYAKIRLSREVTKDDAEEAFAILNFAISHQQANTLNRKRPRPGQIPKDDSDHDEDMQEVDHRPDPPKTRGSAKSRRSPSPSPMDTETHEQTQLRSDSIPREGTAHPKSQQDRAQSSAGIETQETAEDTMRDDDDQVHMASPPPNSSSQGDDSKAISEVQLDIIKNALNVLTKNTDVSNRDELLMQVKNEIPDEAVIEAGILRLVEEGKIVYNDGGIFRV
uniref:DNA replication licensing factor MCM3 n=1 Tax=Rhodosorus marinus TaxID=101924 RepID=A0A7S2ZF84_9RHOD|mmetsp:Transcript_17174/g.69557  ORF Transcript_17174/g.69557 Transcript_17174/m.69557 type:complete len:849 (+) Transcript_17174:99-2645(+)